MLYNIYYQDQLISEFYILMIERLERMMVKLVKVRSLCNIYMVMFIGMIVIVIWVVVKILLGYLYQ